MRTLPAGLAAHLSGEATTLCRCWRVTRKDGAVEGFTDHDRDVVFDGVTFEAASGLSASETTAETGFAAGGLEVAGALRSDRISEADLAAGVYDNARIETFTVNWQVPDERLLLGVGHIGEVTRADGAFRAEVRGLAAALDEPRGRIFGSTCDADLGDVRCRKDLSGPAFTASGTIVAAADGRYFTVSGLDAYPAGWFERGRLSFTSGQNAGRSVAVKAHRLVEGLVVVESWTAMTGAAASGDTFAIVAGCDKFFGTCRDKFANGLNFRGFPHMPGNDFALGYARAGGQNDGTPVAS